MKKILWSITASIWFVLAGCGGSGGGPSSSSSGGGGGGPSSSSSGGSTPPMPPPIQPTPPLDPLPLPPLLDPLTEYERNKGDTYENVGTHPFVVVAHDPLSTFGVDVDTASYDIFRRDLRNYSVLPRPDSVRVEEYINNFKYAYPMPTQADEPFSISLASAPGILDRDTHILRVGIQAAFPETAKKPTNLVFLVDRSGSMATRDKFPLVKKVLTEALNILDPTDTVTLVVYGNGSDVVLGPTKVQQRATIVNAIYDLEAGGFTNGGAGIELAYAQARAGYIEGGINHVILCTDGDFNVGLGADALLELIAAQRATGVTLTALGFGSGNLNDAMMEAVSQAGNGTYAVISSETHAVNYARNRLVSNIRYVAKDVKVQVEFNPQWVSHYRLIGYENRDIGDSEFREDDVDGGEIGAGHQVTALYELVLGGRTPPQIAGAPEAEDGAAYEGPVEVANTDYVRVKLRYKPVDAGADDAVREVAAGLRTLASGLDTADADLRWAAAVAAFAEILKGSPFAGRAHLEQIGAIFAEQPRDADREEFHQLYQRALPKLQ